MDLNNINPVKKFTRALLFVVDKSRSMENVIGAINYAFNRSISIVRTIQERYPDLLFKINVLEFSEKANWRNDSPENVDQYKWVDLVADGVGVEFADVCKKLNEKLSSDVFMKNSNDSPIVLLVDSPLGYNYNEELEKLTGVPRFRQTIKKTIVSGWELRDTDLDALGRFTGKRVNPTPRELKELSKQILDAVTEAALFGRNLDDDFIMQRLNQEKEECDRKISNKSF